MLKSRSHDQNDAIVFLNGPSWGTRLAGTLGIALSLALAASAGDALKPARSAPKAGEEAPRGLIAPGAKNLIANGDFETGTLTPEGWQTIDGLSSFWVRDDDPAHGKVLKFDTDVLQSQAYPWWVQIAQGALPADAPKRQATLEPKYDTLAGLDGVWFWSDPVPVEKNKAYWLTVDVKGPPLLVWLVGYPEKPSTSFGADEAAFQEVLEAKRAGKEPDTTRTRKVFVHKYVWKGQLAAGGAGDWKTYARRAKPFRPTAVTPTVRYVRVLIFPFWPPGNYCVDNVRLVAVDEPIAAP